MKAICITLLTAIILIVLLLPTHFAQADQEAPPFDYAIITADDEYIFVMLIPDERILQAWEYLGKEPTFFRTAVFNTELNLATRQFAIKDKGITELRKVKHWSNSFG